MAAVCATIAAMPEPLPNARHDLTWDDLGGYVYHGAMLGNGVFGALIHRQDPTRWDGDPDTVLWQVNRTDAVETGPRQQEGYCLSRMAMGRFLLRPTGRIQRIALTLDLAAAELRGAITTDRGTLRVRSFVCAERDVLVLEIDAEGGEAVRELAFAPDPSGVIADTGAMDFPESARYEPLNPPARRLRQGGIEVHTQDQPHAGRWWTAAWLRHDAGQRTTLLATLACSHPQTGSPGDPIAILTTAADVGVESLAAAHRAWWATHYARCSLVLPDDQAMERFWWLQQYKLGCTMRGDGPLMDLCGPWYIHSCWRGIWWNFNTQAMSAPVFHANRCELVEPLARTLEANLAQLAANVPAAQRSGGALAIGRASGIDLDSPIDLADGPPLYAGREAGNLVWALHALVRAGDSTGDPRWHARALPLLIGGARLYLTLLQPGADGRLHLPMTFSPEYRPAPDCSYDLQLCAWSLRTLLRLAPGHAQAAEWSAALERLAPSPTGADGVRIGAGVDLDSSHRHFSHLVGWWLGDRGFAGADGELLARSLRHWVSLSDGLAAWSYAAAALFSARLGDSGGARGHLDRFLAGMCGPNSLYREAGMCSETPYVGCAALQELVLQDHGGVIRPFAAVPPGWSSAEFTGFAAAGVVVDGAWRDGRLHRLRLHTPRAITLRIALPGNGDPVTITLAAGEVRELV